MTDPENGESYYYIDITERRTEYETGLFSSRLHVVKRNVYKTGGEARYEAKRLRKIREFRRLGRSFDFSAEHNWAPVVIHGDCTLFLIDCDYDYGQTCFDSQADCRLAIDAIGETDVIKFVLGRRDYVEKK